MEHVSHKLRLIHRVAPSQGETKPVPLVPAPPRMGSPLTSFRPISDLLTSLRTTEERLSLLLEDRTRLGRDLHDSVLQSLYAIGLSLETARRTRPALRRSPERSHRNTVDQLNRLIQEIRGMIKRIADGSVQEMDLREEVAAVATTYEQISSLKITLKLQSSALDLLTREEEQEILNIVRESLSNCVRHAHATQADVTVRMRDHRIRVSIRDNGRGMAADNATPKGYGLANMETRARKLGGSLQLRSKPGRGTRVTAEFPLEPILTPV